MDQSRRYTIALHDLTLGYRDRILLREANIGFGWGEFTALIGRNGTGKSTLLRTVAALAKPLSGTVTLDGADIAELSPSQIATRISFVSTEEVRVANLRVEDAVGLGRTPYTGWAGSLSAEDRRIVAESLELVGMSGFAQKTLDKLSDGERQRVMIARALAQDTPVILLDEPTAFLDLPNKYEICLLLRNLAHLQGKCIIFSTHDLSIALELCDTVAMIMGGEFHCGTAQHLIETGLVQELLSHSQLVFDPATRGVRVREK